MWCGILAFGLAGCDSIATAPAERMPGAAFGLRAVRMSPTAEFATGPELVIGLVEGLEAGSGALPVGRSAALSSELQDGTGALSAPSAPVTWSVVQQPDRRGDVVAAFDAATGAVRGQAPGWVQVQARSAGLVSYNVAIRVAATAGAPVAPATSGERLVSAAGARCLEPRLGERTGVLATVALCAPTTPRQAWTLPVRGATGPVTLFGGTMCLDLSRGSARPGTTVGTYACVAGAVNQQWVRTAAGELRGPTGLCLTVNEGTPPGLSVETCTGARPQKWAVASVAAPSVEPVPAVERAPTTLPEEEPSTAATALKSAGGFGCMQPRGARIDTYEAEMAPCVAGQAAQTWSLPRIGTRGTITMGSTFCMTGWGGRGVPGTRVGLWPCGTNLPDQQWVVTAAGEIRGQNDLCVTVTGGSPPIVTLQACGGLTSQLWAVPGTGAAAPLTVAMDQSQATAVPTGALQSTVVPPAGAQSIPVLLRRFDGADGDVVVSNAIPLAPGALWAGQERRVRLVLGTGDAMVEQGLYAAPLASRHRDGSLRTVLVQFRVRMGANDQYRGRIELGAGDRPSALTIASPVGPAQASPSAAVLPSDPEYLIRTDLVGSTITAARGAALGGVFARYEGDFAGYADPAWANSGATWEQNYYDRALIYYAWWVRTGNPTYWWRATRFATVYRTGYVEANGYAASPHWAQLEGLEKHYILTGDEASRVAVLRMAENFTRYLPEYYGSESSESRIMARFILSALLSWRLTPAGQTPTGIAPRDWGAQIDFLLEKNRVWQHADGSYPAKMLCGGQLNYMVGLLNDVLIKTYEQYRQDPRLVDVVRRANDYMWATQWVPSRQLFAYASVACPNVGDQTPANDLNGLFVTSYGWLYKQTGDARYRTAGDAILAGAVQNAVLTGTKQFNQQYTSSFRYLGYR